VEEFCVFSTGCQLCDSYNDTVFVLGGGRGDYLRTKNCDKENLRIIETNAFQMPLGVDHVLIPTGAIEKARVELLCVQMKTTATDRSLQKTQIEGQIVQMGV
jgi:hypothetical protein